MSLSTKTMSAKDVFRIGNISSDQSDAAVCSSPLSWLSSSKRDHREILLQRIVNLYPCQRRDHSELCCLLEYLMSWNRKSFLARRVCVCVCVCVCVLVVYYKAQRISNREFKLWTILQRTECRLSTFHAETCVMFHQSLPPLSVRVCACVCEVRVVARDTASA